MASKSNIWLNALAEVVRSHPKVSAAIAFELGVIAATAFKSVRLRKSLNGSSAKVIDAIPLLSSAPPLRVRKKRRSAARKRKPAKRARAVRAAAA